MSTQLPARTPETQLFSGLPSTTTQLLQMHKALRRKQQREQFVARQNDRVPPPEQRLRDIET